MKIDYKNYKVYPYTLSYLKSHYATNILKKYGKVLAFLEQNGYHCSTDSLEDLEDQFWFFNGFKTYEDFEELKKLSNFEIGATKFGYKIFADEIADIMRSCNWADKYYENLKVYSNIFFDEIKDTVYKLDDFLRSPDLEVQRTVKELCDNEFMNELEECIDFADNEEKVRLLVTFQKLFKKIKSLRGAVNVKLMNDTEKGKSKRVENVSEELYGVNGGCNKNTDEIIAKYGSVVNDLKRLVSNESDESLMGRLRVLASESVENGETDKTIVSFARGKNSDFKAVRKALAEVCFNGITALVSLKNGVKLYDCHNKNVVKNVGQELAAICKYCGYKEKVFA